jgi:hypothetical protein
MTNTNCLENIKCPACGNEESFRIAAKTIATVTDDGTEEHGDMEWDDDSYAECTACPRHGTLKDFTVRRDLEPASVKRSPTIWQDDYTRQFYDAPGGYPDAAIDFIEIRSDVTEAGWHTVAYVPAGWPDAKADARLIAAAPRLLRFVERRLSTQPGDTYKGYISGQELKAEAEALYAKAITREVQAA